MPGATQALRAARPGIAGVTGAMGLGAGGPGVVGPAPFSRLPAHALNL